MIRKAVIIACLLAAIGCGLGWKRSYSCWIPTNIWRYTDPPAGAGWKWAWTVDPSRAVAASGRFGKFTLVLVTVPQPGLSFLDANLLARLVLMEPPWAPSDHFVFYRDNPTGPGGTGPIYDMWIVVVPFWSLTALCAAVPTCLYIRGPVRRWRRRRKGLCVNCGYDLTGNVTSVCSECGERI